MGQIDTMDVKVKLFNGCVRVLSLLFVAPNGHEVRVHESLFQVTSMVNIVAVIKRLDGNVVRMNRNRKMLDYVDQLIDGTLLLREGGYNNSPLIITKSADEKSGEPTKETVTPCSSDDAVCSDQTSAHAVPDLENENSKGSKTEPKSTDFHAITRLLDTLKEPIKEMVASRLRDARVCPDQIPVDILLALENAVIIVNIPAIIVDKKEVTIHQNRPSIHCKNTTIKKANNVYIDGPSEAEDSSSDDDGEQTQEAMETN